jgi:hypothetical protein
VVGLAGGAASVRGGEEVADDSNLEADGRRRWSDREAMWRATLTRGNRFAETICGDGSLHAPTTLPLPMWPDLP